MRKLCILLAAGVPAICLLFCTSLFAADIPDSPDGLQRVTIAEVKAMQSRGEEILFIDTRTGGQWNQAKGIIKDAIHLTERSDLGSFKQATPVDQAIVTYCT